MGLFSKKKPERDMFKNGLPPPLPPSKFDFTSPPEAPHVVIAPAPQAPPPAPPQAPQPATPPQAAPQQAPAEQPAPAPEQPEQEESFELPDFNDSEIEELSRIELPKPAPQQAPAEQPAPAPEQPKQEEPKAVEPRPEAAPPKELPAVEDKPKPELAPIAVAPPAPVDNGKLLDIRVCIDLKGALEELKSDVKKTGEVIDRFSTQDKSQKHSELTSSLNFVQEKLMFIDNKLFEVER